MTCLYTLATSDDDEKANVDCLDTYESAAFVRWNDAAQVWMTPH